MNAAVRYLLPILLALPIWASAQPEQHCRDVRLGVVDWTDLHVANGIAKELLERIGYSVQLSDQPATPQVFEQMQGGKIDAFLGYWTPAMIDIAGPFYGSGSVKTLTTNLDDARWTLAVPEYVYDQGVRDFADIAKFEDKFQGRIYGLEKGSSGNAAVLDMIKTNAFGLGSFELIETSERLMLAQVKGRVRKGEWIVFLGWAPHPMNQHYALKYLSGGDEFFGPEYGKAAVNTSIRKDLDQNCPNLARFLNNLVFEAPVEEAIMDKISNEFVPVERAVRMWMHQNPEYVSRWLNGVNGLDGKPVNHQSLVSSLEVTWGR